LARDWKKGNLGLAGLGLDGISWGFPGIPINLGPLGGICLGALGFGTKGRKVKNSLERPGLKEEFGGPLGRLEPGGPGPWLGESQRTCGNHNLGAWDWAFGDPQGGPLGFPTGENWEITGGTTREGSLGAQGGKRGEPNNFNSTLVGLGIWVGPVGDKKKNRGAP